MVNVQILLRIDARFTPMLTAFRNTFGVAASSAGMPTDSSRCICILGSKLPTDRGGMGGGGIKYTDASLLLHIDAHYTTWHHRCLMKQVSSTASASVPTDTTAPSGGCPTGDGCLKNSTTFNRTSEEGITLHIDDGCLGGGKNNIDRGIGNFFRPEIGFENMPSPLFHYSRRSTFSYCFFQDTMEEDDPLYEQRDLANGVSLGEKSFCMPILDCTPQQVAYRLGRYLAIHSLPNIHSSDSDGDGLNDFVEDWYGSRINHGDTDGDGLGDALEVELFKDPKNPYDVHGFDLTISFNFYRNDNDIQHMRPEPYTGEEVINNFIEGMRSTSNVLLDATDGYFFINSLTVKTLDDGGNIWEGADIRVYKDLTDFQAKGPVTKVHHTILQDGVPEYVKLHAGHGENVAADPIYMDWVGNDEIISHEFGHYLFWLGEEYETYKEKRYATIRSEYREEMSAEDLDKYDESIYYFYSTMNIYKNTEFSTYTDYNGENGWLGTRDYLVRAYSNINIEIDDIDQYHDNNKESCWETIFRMTNRIDGYNELIDFDLDVDGQADSHYYNSYVNHEGPTYDIGKKMIVI